MNNKGVYQYGLMRRLICAFAISIIMQIAAFFMFELISVISKRQSWNKENNKLTKHVLFEHSQNGLTLKCTLHGTTSRDHMSPVSRKPVIGVSDLVILKPVSVRETS